MELATLIENHRAAFEAKYADRLLPAHLHALDAICRCRTAVAGEVLARCSACGQTQWHPKCCFPHSSARPFPDNSAPGKTAFTGLFGVHLPLSRRWTTGGAWDKEVKNRSHDIERGAHPLDEREPTDD